MKPPKFPNVRCGKPGHPDAPGYIVCVHVVDGGRAPACCIAPTETSLGEIACVECNARDDVPADLMVLVCASCAERWTRDRPTVTLVGKRRVQ